MRTGAPTYILCFNCGVITPEKDWSYLKYIDSEDGNDLVLVPSEEGDYDPIMKCPNCQWLHQDTDDNPGIMEGTEIEMRRERRNNLSDYADLWK